MANDQQDNIAGVVSIAEEANNEGDMVVAGPLGEGASVIPAPTQNGDVLTASLSAPGKMSFQPVNVVSDAIVAGSHLFANLNLGY